MSIGIKDKGSQLYPPPSKDHPVCSGTARPTYAAQDDNKQKKQQGPEIRADKQQAITWAHYNLQKGTTQHA